MNQEDIKKKQKKIMIYVMLLCIVLAVGASYAYFTAGITSEDETTVTAEGGIMKINYHGGNTINLSGIYPRDEAWATKIITVTGNNTTDAEMFYTLTLVVDYNTFRPDDPLEYELISINTSNNGKVVQAVNKTSLTNIKTELGKGNFLKADNAVHTYQLKIYYPLKDTDQNSNQGAIFNAHVEIGDSKTAKTNGLLADSVKYNSEVAAPLSTPVSEVSAYTLDDVESQTKTVSATEQSKYITYGTNWIASGTGFELSETSVTSDTYANSYSDLVGKYIISNDLTKAGLSSATKIKLTEIESVYYIESATATSLTYKILSSNKNTTEAVLASTEDDYGTSYYFRGVVKNNYVEFANKCWRIVRITGNGAIKLVLHNDNTSKASNPCSSVNNSPTAAFAHYDGSTYTSRFNSSYTDNAYIGFMYGATGASDYASTHANTNKSTILTNLEKWYENNLIEYEDKLADIIWCNDKSTANNELGYGGNRNDYSATNRLYSTEVSTLICSSDNNGGKLSKFTTDDTTYGNGNLTYKVGLLTADEAAFAGLSGHGSDKKAVCYLTENANEYWWTLTPATFFRISAVVFQINNNFSYDEVGLDKAVRPTIALNPSVSITGEGTSENPYKVV